MREIYMDVGGPMPVRGLHGELYFSACVHMKSKTSAPNQTWKYRTHHSHSQTYQSHGFHGAPKSEQYSF
jgi:hypothetical protein